jgi:xanthine dehydrogenase YagR molybdenum-binding subunit
MSEIAPTRDPTHARHGSNAGQPLTRLDGPLKVTGRATYAADKRPDGLLYAALAVSRIARGRVAALDVAAAKRHAGVVEVMTAENRPPIFVDPDLHDQPFNFKFEALQNDRVRYAGQPIAVVIAETLEAATEGAALLAPRYESETPHTDIDAGESYTPPFVGPGHPATAEKGDVDAGLAAAALTLDATYETPFQFHNAMEPHAIVAAFEGDRLVIDTPTQALAFGRLRFAQIFGLSPDKVLVRCPFLGGGFGGKGLMSGPLVLGALAAKLTGRPVKLVMSRAQLYGPFGHRSPTRQRLRLGVDQDGRLTALAHHAKVAASSFEDFYEPSAGVSQTLYASPAICTSHEAVRLDTGTPMFVRAPGEASGSIALESAIDEMADVAGMDPLQFRLLNYAEIEPISGKPFSSKALRECFAEGAKAFGWEGRPLAPRQIRDSDGLLVGWGMGVATFPAVMFQGVARAVLRADGTGYVETTVQDMGQGALTAFAQIGADALALPLDKFELRSGTSAFPDGGMAGGSGHTATAGLAIHNAGGDVIAKLAALATNDPASPLYGAGNAGVIARDGSLMRQDDESRRESYAAILARAGVAEIAGEGKGAADAAAQAQYAMHAHGAVFAEVKVDPDLGMVRVTRLVGAFAAGRIINPRLVRSQYYGGMIWGVGFALHEKAIFDQRTGRIVNADLAEYRIPTHADIPDMQAILIEERDPHVNALGVKGVGEIGVTGTAGAVANAVWHATGVRVRKFPIRPEALLWRA